MTQAGLELTLPPKYRKLVSKSLVALLRSRRYIMQDSNIMEMLLLPLSHRWQDIIHIAMCLHLFLLNNILGISLSSDTKGSHLS